MRFEKQNKEKEYVCRMCLSFFDSNELKNGCCGDCNTDEYVFLNDIKDEDYYKKLKAD